MNAARRFYKHAAAKEVEGGFGVALDERTLRTPKGAVFAAPTRALAAACAAEWDAQAENIVPATMPITQLAFAAVDWVRPARDERIDYVIAHAGTDLLCHRAESPNDLVARQAAAWDPIVAWVDERLGARLPVVSGIIAADVSQDALTTLRKHAEALDDFRLMALTQGVGLTGSALLAFAMVEDRLDAEAAFAAAALDNLWSLERWGEDEEARTRLNRTRGELIALGRFLETLRDA